MEEYIKWLENKIEECLEDKDLQREHWAFCQALKKCRELVLEQPLVTEQIEKLICKHCKGTGYDGFDRCVPPNPYICNKCTGNGFV